MDIMDTIKHQVTNAHVVLYMKGEPDFPQCGFSARAVQILKLCDIPEFDSYNVLTEPELREAMKVFSNWPTFPQLYIDGEFIGGCDIMTEMYESGELQELLRQAFAD